MKKYDNFELLLHAAAESYMEKEAEEFKARDTSHIPDNPRMQKKIEKLARHAQSPHRFKWYKLLAVACLAALILATTACLAISEIREKFYEAFVQIFDRYVAVDFEEGNPNAKPPEETESETETESESLPLDPPAQIEHKAYASYLPEAYTCVVEAEDELYYFLSYYDLNSNWKFTLSQELIYDAPHFNDIEEQQSEIIYIRGNQGVLFSDSAQPGYYILVWRDSFYQYSIHGTFSSVEVLKKVAEGISFE